MNVLLITPPLTQLNTPYPATPHLAGFLKSRGYDVCQSDLGILLVNTIFSQKGFSRLFDAASHTKRTLSKNARAMLKNQARYLRTIEPVMRFLQYKDNTLSQLICSESFLPRASRFQTLPDTAWAFGSAGVNDQARFLATLYIEDVGDLIREAVTPHFGFSRYAERLGLSARSFAPLEHALNQPDTAIELWLGEMLQARMEACRPDVVGITIPFPGNVFAALKCGQFIKQHFPHVPVVAGGGYVNTELRDLSEPAVFDYLDFITLDDGELPLLRILEHLQGKAKLSELVRTFIREEGRVRYVNDADATDIHPAETGCPDYDGLDPDQYLSLIEMANPMHRMWSDGCFNKLAVAHGCYWGRCAFCDTTLPYISRYACTPASVLADRIVQIIAQTGRRGFHFVDEAAPPSALKALAQELIRRDIVISWWTNIRFEKAFDEGLCELLAKSGCVAVTGGLETASDRLLNLMNKGVTVRQAAIACDHFTRAGIMVHAYLMYGFPTQTAQETLDALEIVRQLFHEGLLQSAFWHRFVATAHSDVGKNPKTYSCVIQAVPAGGFAGNDLPHSDPEGCVHDDFALGLNKAVYNFMHGIGTDMALTDWFDFPVPKTSVKKSFVRQAISQPDPSRPTR